MVPKHSVIRTLDVMITLGVLLPALLVLAVAGLAIAITDGRPIIFSQQRVGLRGKRFRIYKLRSMSNSQKFALLQLQTLSRRDRKLLKPENDPRITQVGRFIRKLSIDELPQLYNVLKGEMSIVGPRPALENEFRMYSAREKKRFSTKPGITGLAQVNNRNPNHSSEWFLLDERWNKFISVALYLQVVLRTFYVLNKGR